MINVMIHCRPSGSYIPGEVSQNKDPKLYSFEIRVSRYNAFGCGESGRIAKCLFSLLIKYLIFFLRNHASLLSQQCCLNGIGCIPLITRVGTWCGQSIPLHAPCCLAQQWRNDWVLRLLELLEEKHPEPVKYSVQTGSLSVPTNRISREKCRLPAYILASLFLLLDCPLSEILPVFKFKLNHWYLLLQEL